TTETSAEPSQRSGSVPSGRSGARTASGTANVMSASRRHSARRKTRGARRSAVTPRSHRMDARANEVLGEDLVIRGDEAVRVLAREDERRLHLDHVVERPVGGEEEALLLHPLDDVGSLLRRGLERRPVTHELDPEE